MVANVLHRRSPRRRRRSEPRTYHAFIVRPRPGFNPEDWRQRPSSYEIVSYEGTKPFRGQVDAWLFLQNQQAIQSGNLDRWAIFIPHDPNDGKSEELRLRRPNRAQSSTNIQPSTN